VSKTWDSPFRKRLREHTAKVANLRVQIREAGEEISDWELRDMWDEARFELEKARLFGDLVVAAFFEGTNAKERESRRDVYVQAVSAGEEDGYSGMLDEWRQADPPLAPFHWELEFPEVFDRRSSGFDSTVGNPPFGGKNTVASANVPRYLDWLKQIHEESHGNADVVAHFFRRVFGLIRDDGTFGLLATNTIAQGDTRSTGLRWICTNGGAIYNATKRYKWPGMAAVVVSVVHVIKGEHLGSRILDGEDVETITAYLFHRGGHQDPAPLRANSSMSYTGDYVHGVGFLFDSSDSSGLATPTRELERILKANPNSAEAIFPYIGGQEVNSSPTQTPSRYVIDFGERSEAECRSRWPELMEIVEERVKPSRIEKDADKFPRLVNEWWKFASRGRDRMLEQLGLERVLMHPNVSQNLGFVFLDSSIVIGKPHNTFYYENYAAFSVLQSRTHETWARFFGSSMKDDLRYTPSDCFETFPFPEGWRKRSAREAVGAV
jgi:hypothetical protein